MIRESSEKDLKDILEIYNDAILNTTSIYAYKIQNLEEKKQWYEKKKQDGYPLIVFEESGRVVGRSGIRTRGPGNFPGPFSWEVFLWLCAASP